jgi:hypothetical protein
MIVTCNGQENQMKAINDHEQPETIMKEQPETIMKEQPETIMKEQLAYVDKTKNQLY